MLANKRKHKVIGRTIILTISTILRNEMRYQGEFAGTKVETLLLFNESNKTLKNHKTKANLKLKARVVVTGYL